MKFTHTHFLDLATALTLICKIINITWLCLHFKSYMDDFMTLHLGEICNNSWNFVFKINPGLEQLSACSGPCMYHVCKSSQMYTRKRACKLRDSFPFLLPYLNVFCSQFPVLWRHKRYVFVLYSRVFVFNLMF